MDFEKLRQRRNTTNAFAQKLGIVLQEIRLGYARATKTIQTDETNPAMTTHGGVYFTLADVTAGAASASHGFDTATVSSTYNYFRSCHPGDVLTAEATELKAGRTLCVYDVKVTDQNGTLVGDGTFTLFLTDHKLEV